MRCKLVIAILAACAVAFTAEETGGEAAISLTVRPVRGEQGWFEQDCWGDVEYSVDLLKPRLRRNEPVELHVQIVNNCQRCGAPIKKNSRLWIEDGQQGVPHFSKASRPVEAAINCHERHSIFLGLFVSRMNKGVADLPIRLNVSLQNPRGYNMAAGFAVVDMPFYAYQSMFEAEHDINLLMIGFPGVGKTTFIMSGISALSLVPQQLPNVGGATLEGHTTQMITKYPLAEWAENARLRVNLWDTWGVRPLNFSTDLLDALCDGRVPHGFQMQVYEQGEKQFKSMAFTSARPMDAVLFFLRADHIKHPEGLPLLRHYLNSVKTRGYGAIMVVTWLHLVPDADRVLQELRRKLQIPVLPFTKGCHPSCRVQPPWEVSSVAVEKDPEVEKHALVALEWALRLATSAARVQATASWSKAVLAACKRMAAAWSHFWTWLLAAAWGCETVIVLALSLLAVLAVTSQSTWATLSTLWPNMAGVPPYRQRELVPPLMLRQLLVVLSLLYQHVQQSLPSAESWVVHGSTQCAEGIDTVPISSLYSQTSDVTSGKCKEECLREPECAMFSFGSSKGFFNKGMRCELYRSCEFVHFPGRAVHEKPVQTWVVGLSALAHVAQLAVNFMRLLSSQWSGVCLLLTAALCLLSAQLCWRVPASSPLTLPLMLHAANLCVLLAMNQQLRERLLALTSEEAGKEQRLKGLELLLFTEARRAGQSLQDRQTLRAQLELTLGVGLTATIIGLLWYCTANLSGGAGSWSYNLGNLLTRFAVGVELRGLLRSCFLIVGAFILSSPLVVGLRFVQRGLLGLLEDPQAELERSAALIATKAHAIEKMLNCLKPKLRTPGEIARSELEDMADGMCLRRSSPDRSALICAAVTYFRHQDRVTEMEGTGRTTPLPRLRSRPRSPTAPRSCWRSAWTPHASPPRCSSRGGTSAQSSLQLRRRPRAASRASLVHLPKSLRLCALAASTSAGPAGGAGIPSRSSHVPQTRSAKRSGGPIQWVSIDAQSAALLLALETARNKNQKGYFQWTLHRRACTAALVSRSRRRRRRVARSEEPSCESGIGASSSPLADVP